MAHMKDVRFSPTLGECRAESGRGARALSCWSQTRKGGLPTGPRGMERRVYTKNHFFRIQKQKGNSVCLGAFWFSSWTKADNNSFILPSRGYLITLSPRNRTDSGIVTVDLLRRLQI